MLHSRQLFRNGWKGQSNKDKPYNDIKNKKQSRQDTNNMIADIKYQLQKKRRELYLSRHIVRKGNDGRRKLEINHTHFGGTDNDLVSMTETRVFTMKKFVPIGMTVNKKLTCHVNMIGTNAEMFTRAAVSE
ncbi:hypothetical protein INT48_005412 [Thamnidium elegans]|uniref:Uncharacterized protein n=1 Tax=Thamnidium elegans TaxID=101142 RepID=A0A8H7VV41_9FUNG|nr:hypothetical protein INT48_005412 [Thamnidium elegans]